MPVFALHPWSQFNCPAGTPPDPGSRLTHRGGAPVPLLMGEADDGPSWRLTQATWIDGEAIARDAEVTAGDGFEGTTGTQGHVIALDGRPMGVVLTKGRLRPEDRVTLLDWPGAMDPAPQEHQGVLCFAAGTLIMTPTGARRVETLRPGALVTTRDNGPQPLIWTGRREVLFARGDNRFRPILFRPGSLGAGLPERDLIVPPHHQPVVEGPDDEETAGHPRMLAPAGAIADLRGARQMLGKRRITYVHVLLDTHEVLLAEGVEAESLYPHPQALAAMTDRQRAAIFGLLPQLRDDPMDGFGRPALPVMDNRAALALAITRKARPEMAEPAFDIAAE